jgi:murein L,D-transpeptidase YcbB/YkuD
MRIEPRPLLVLAIVIAVSACRPNGAQQGGTQAPDPVRIADAFATTEVYSHERLDSLSLLALLAADTVHDAYDPLVLDFYRRRGMQYAWFQGDSLSSAALSFLDLSGTPGSEQGPWQAAHAELHDLVEALRDTMDRSVDRAYVEVLLTAEFFHFADKRYGGAARDLRALDWYIPRAKKDYARLLDSLVAGSRDLAAMEPVLPMYQALKPWLRRYRALELDSTWAPVHMDRERYLPGDSAAVLGEVRNLLHKWGDLADSSGSGRFDSTLAGGVRRFRERHGLKVVNVVDRMLVDVLNVPPADRVRQILLNMERLRWMPDEPFDDLLLVNIPAFRLHVYEQGRVAWSMDVVVGREATRTVIFSDSLSQIVFAPYWNIPQSIIRDEVLPAVKRDSRYLDRKNMEVVRGGVVVPSRSIDWNRYRSSVPFVIRQRPGPGNALGRVKFLFPNRYSIYLHDTPSKGGFLKEQRAFSHGCIRLSDPLRLARHLLRNDTAWTPDRIARTADGTAETIVPVGPPVPVVIGYFTAWVDDEGRVNFRDDVYGHDARLAEELFANAPDTYRPARTLPQPK